MQRCKKINMTGPDITVQHLSNYQIVAKEGFYYILKGKALTAKLFADIRSIEEFFHFLESRPYFTSHVIITERNSKTETTYFQEAKAIISDVIRFVRAITIFQTWCPPKAFHLFAVENASKQLTTKYRPQQSLSDSSRSDPPPPPSPLPPSYI